MAHFEKYTAASTWQLLEHDKHTRDGEHIDKERTQLNYNLQHRSEPWQFVKDKIDMSKKSGARFNSRSVALVSCVITLPKGYDGDPRQFFEECKKYLDGLFSSENCASAWVHMDEQSPHLHYKFCPIVKEGDVLKFNAKKLVSRSFLQQFHKDLEKHLTAVLGRSTGILNGATTHGNQTTEQLHRLTEATQRLCEVQKECDELQRQLADLSRLKGLATAELRSVCDMVETMSQKLEALKREVFTLEGDDFSPMFRGLDDRDR